MSDTSYPTIIHGVMHPMRDYYTRIGVEEMPNVAEMMVGTKLTCFGEEIGEVIEAWVENNIIHYRAKFENYHYSQPTIIGEDKR